MKNHLFLIPFLTFASAAATIHARPQSSAFTDAPVNMAQNSRETEEQTFDFVPTGAYGQNGPHCDCDKCQKGKKGKGHRGHGNNGKHHGKHRNKHACSCHHHDCGNDNGYRHDRGDRRRYGQNDRRDNDEWNSGDRDSDRRYETSNRGQEQNSRGNTRAGKHTSSAKVKTRPTPGARRTSAPTGAQKRRAPSVRG